MTLLTPAAFVLTLAMMSLAFVAPVAAQHEHEQNEKAESETWSVTGLRIDDSAPPPGSAVARAAVRLAGGGYAHVVYGRPYARGRQVFGGLVAFGQVWATGAHRATEIVTTVPLQFGDHRLEAGVYSLFTTPTKETWTLHFNRGLGMHLADEYDAEKDVLTVSSSPIGLSEVVQGLTIDFQTGEGQALSLRIRWDQTSVSFPFHVVD